MICYSQMRGDKEFLYTDTKKKKKVWVATFLKGKIYSCNYNLEYGFYNGYYFKKMDNSTPEEENECLIDQNTTFPWNLSRVCTNRKSWLKSHYKLRYQKCEISIFDNPYKELELRLKHPKNVELLEKFLIQAHLKNDYSYASLLSSVSVLKLNGKATIEFIKYLSENYSYFAFHGAKALLNAFKGGFKDYPSYEYKNDIKRVEKKLGLNEKDAKYFYKLYKKDLGLDNAISIYKDTLKLSKELGKSSIGFPRDLKDYEWKLITLKREMENKDKEEKLKENMAKISVNSGNLTKRGYEINLLNKVKSFSDIAEEFHNCIYSTYFTMCSDGKYAVLLIKKNNEDYACMGFNINGNKGQFDQCYKKNNESLETRELNIFKRNIKLEMRV